MSPWSITCSNIYWNTALAAIRYTVAAYYTRTRQYTRYLELRGCFSLKNLVVKVTVLRVEKGKKNRKIGPHDGYGDKGIDVFNNTRDAVLSDQLLVTLSYVFDQRRGNSCPPPGESGDGAASRQVVVVRPPPPAISSVWPTTFLYGLRSCPAAVIVAKSYGYRTFLEKLPACGTVKTPWWHPLTRRGR